MEQTVPILQCVRPCFYAKQIFKRNSKKYLVVFIEES